MRSILVTIILTLAGSVYASCTLSSFYMNANGTVTTSTVVLSWGASTGGESTTTYRVQRSTNGGSTWTNTNITNTTSTSATITGLSSGTTYLFRVQARNECTVFDPEIGVPIPQVIIQYSSDTESATTIPGSPSSSSPTNFTSSSMVANWSTTTGATSYRLDVSTSSIFSSYISGYQDRYISGSSTDSHTITGLTPGVTYYYRVRAVNGGGTSSNSITRNGETLPEDPVIGSASDIAQNSFTANWSASAGATDYRLYVSTNSSFIGHVTNYNGAVVNGTSASVTGLNGGYTYYFRVRAANDDDDLSGNSNFNSAITIPEDPVLEAASDVTQTSFTANWESMVGTNDYHLYMSSDPTFTTYDLSSTASTSQSFVDLEAGKTYYYRVSGSNVTGTSDTTGTMSVTLVPGEPGAQTASGISQDSYELNWDDVLGTTSYDIEVSLQEDFNEFVVGYPKNVANSNENLSGLLPGRAYFSRIKATNSEGSSGYSEVRSVLLVSANPDAEAASNYTSSGFTANWESVIGAESYLLDVSTSSDFSSFVSGYEQKPVIADYEVITGLDPATEYFYRVKAVNASGNSDFGSHSSALTTTSAPVNISVSAHTKSSFNISWDAVPDATNYLLDISEASDFAEFIAGYDGKSVAGTSENVTSLTAGETYFIRLRSENGSGESENSDVVEGLVVPTEPTIGDPTSISLTGFTVNWGTVTGACSYIVQISENEDFSDASEFQSSTNNRSLVNLSAGKTYYFRTKAVNASGESGYSPSNSVLLVPEKPSGIIITNISQTGFNISWNAVTGAGNYLLDVSQNEDFSNFLEGYHDKSVALNQEAITNLSPGNEYHVRLRTQNDTKISGYSQSVAILLIPAETTAEEGQDVTQTSFKTIWDAVSGAEFYLVELATDEDFQNYVAGFERDTVTATEIEFSGLTPGQTFFYRVTPGNKSGNASSTATKSVLMVPGNPVDIKSGQVGYADMEISWGVGLGVETYLVDVATDDGFETITDGYQEATVTSNSIKLEGLEPGRTYFTRVKSKNSTGISGYSETISKITLPPIPTISGFSETTPTRFKISWAQGIGIESYEIMVSEDEGFQNLVDGFGPKTVDKSFTEVIVTDLSPNTIYFIKMRSRNSSGYSEYSSSKATSTQNADGSVSLPSITEISISNDEPRSLSFSATSSLGSLASVRVLHKAISQNDFSVDSLASASDGKYELEVESDWLDMLGMQYEIIAEDIAGRFSSSGIRKLTVDPQSTEIVPERFGKSAGDYTIVSIPYELSNPSIRDVFERIMGSYDKTKWRLLHYSNGTFQDYNDGLSASDLQRGKSYWFASANEVVLDFGEAQAPPNTIEEPFELQLKTGWNQIANPYPFEIFWSDVLTHNGEPAGVSDQLVYNAENMSLEAVDVMTPFEGGFVHSDEAITLVIPVTFGNDEFVSNRGARLELAGISEGWELPISITNGEVLNTNTSIGMKKGAFKIYDSFDLVSPPKFHQYLTLESKIDNRILIKDFRSISHEAAWSLEISGNVKGNRILSWDPEDIMAYDKGSYLFLLEPLTGKVIDMKAIESFQLPSRSTSIEIYFSQVKPDFIEKAGTVEIGTPYPNPARGPVYLPYSISFKESPQIETQLQVFDQAGNLIFTQADSAEGKGVHEMIWNGDFQNGSHVPNGIYYYHLTIVEDGIPKRNKGKIIVQN